MTESIPASFKALGESGSLHGELSAFQSLSRIAQRHADMCINIHSERTVDSLMTLAISKKRLATQDFTITLTPFGYANDNGTPKQRESSSD